MLFVKLDTCAYQDLKKVGAYRYTRDGDFEIRVITYAFDNGDIIQATTEEEKKEAVKLIGGLKHKKVVCGAEFVRCALTTCAENIYHTTIIDLLKLSAALGLPHRLSSLARTLSLPVPPSLTYTKTPFAEMTEEERAKLLEHNRGRLDLMRKCFNNLTDQMRLITSKEIDLMHATER